MDFAVSIVMITYNMTQQARRTLLSLSPAHRKGLPCGEVEVIVVDNGSDPPPTLLDLATPGLAVSLHRWPSPGPSPVAAVNFGLSLARAPVVAVMIDGARMASPGLIGAGVAACALHPRAVVATYNYHLGHKPQHESIHEGYDEAVEAALLASIGWPEDGYRLFDIAVPTSGGTWPGPLVESNALFLRRAMWDELGGYETRFRTAGGGGANPDVFARACALPGAQLIKIAGEATFHQFHGGTIANMKDRGALRTLLLEYAKIRGRPLAPVREPGWILDSRTGAVTCPP